MNKIVNLEVYSLTEKLLSVDIKKLTFKGKEGYVTILPNHIDYVSSFDSNILSYVDEKDEEKFVALNKGIFTKNKNKIKVTTYHAFIGDNIQSLNEKVKNSLTENENFEKIVNTSSKQLEFFLFNNLIGMK
jgi:alternate F1F0 ATPase F1 subunit epsilon